MQDPRYVISGHAADTQRHHSNALDAQVVGFSRNSGYNQSRGYSRSDARYHQSFSGNEPESHSPRQECHGQGYPAQQYGQHLDASYVSDMRQTGSDSATSREATQQPYAYGNPSPDARQGMSYSGPDPTAYTAAPRQYMQLISPTIEKAQMPNNKTTVMAQHAHERSQSPPPAYTSEARLPPQPRSSYSSNSSGHFIPGQVPLQPAGSMGQLADGYKLVAVPATSAALGSPFLRAYPPALQGYGISREAFLQFLDRLNRAAVASPPIQVLGLAGNIVSMVPLHTAQIVGSVVDLAAQASTIAISKGRTEMLLKEVNSSLFKEAGLKAQVAKLDVVAKLANIPILTAEGKVDKKSSILLPLSQDEDFRLVNAQERRIRALSPWISPLDVNALPAIDSQTNMFGKMHAAVSERQRKKEEEKTMKDRKKMTKGYAKKDKEEDEYGEKMEEYVAKENKIREKDGRRMERELRELEKKRDRAAREHDKEIDKIEKHRRKDDKEEGSMRKILFLIIQKV